ncbi:MAG: hypothetical protein K0U98_03705 [Deltaproteobacteria bacterium]|nr:hypothetical protein [Deltaproteobacteria bacterium]
MKYVNTLRQGLLGCLLAAFAIGLFLPGTAQANTDGDRITLGICCAVGVVDQHWRITIEIKDADGNSLGTVTHKIPYHTTVQAAAESLKDKIEEKFGITGVKREESAPRNDKGNKIQLEDLVLPAGYCFGKVKTEKKVGKTWKPRHGHLKVFKNGKRINNRLHLANQSGGADSSLPRTYTPGDSLEAGGQVLQSAPPAPGRDGEAGGNNEAPFGWVSISLEAFDVDPLVVLLELGGTDVDGNDVFYAFESEFPRETPIEAVLAALANFAQSHGMAVDLPAPGELTIFPGSNGDEIYSWLFAAGAFNGSCEPDLEDDPPEDPNRPPAYFGVTFDASAGS